MSEQAPVRNMDDPENRAFWERLEARAEAFDRRAPHWFKCAGCDECKPKEET